MNARALPIATTGIVRRVRPVIGARWKPGRVERHDTETGVYECVNSTLESQAEATVQRALFLKDLDLQTERRIAAARVATHVTREAP